MNREKAEQLTRIYNTLLTVKTSGEDTITMGVCLNAFKTFMTNLKIVDEATSQSEENHI